MIDPLAWLPVAARSHLFVLTALPAALVLVALTASGRALKTSVSPRGILSYEFAGSVMQAQAMIAAWGERGRQLAMLNLGLDYAFLLTYGPALALACSLTATGVAPLHSGYSAAGAPLAWGALLAALLDMVENYALIRLLLGATSARLPRLAWICAAIKFLLVTAALLYALVGLLLRT